MTMTLGRQKPKFTLHSHMKVGICVKILYEGRHLCENFKNLTKGSGDVEIEWLQLTCTCDL